MGRKRKTPTLPDACWLPKVRAVRLSADLLGRLVDILPSSVPRSPATASRVRSSLRRANRAALQLHQVALGAAESELDPSRAGRPPAGHPAFRRWCFLVALLWVRLTGKPPARHICKTDNPVRARTGERSTWGREAGRFSRFVLIASEMLPAEIRPDKGSLDRIVRDLAGLLPKTTPTK